MEGRLEGEERERMERRGWGNDKEKEEKKRKRSGRSWWGATTAKFFHFIFKFAIFCLIFLWRNIISIHNVIIEVHVFSNISSVSSFVDLFNLQHKFFCEKQVEKPH